MVKPRTNITKSLQTTCSNYLSIRISLSGGVVEIWSVDLVSWANEIPVGFSCLDIGFHPIINLQNYVGLYFMTNGLENRST